jgi:AmiR/NasT family two-component response regulator
MDDPLRFHSLEEARVAVARLLTVTRASYERRSQLEHALESRIVIEQAKGVLAERLQIPIETAFEVLRRASRDRRVKLHEIARDVVASGETPPAILAALRKAAERSVV